MRALRKIPLEGLIQILKDLYDGGADYIDISGEENEEDNNKDVIKITVRPEYMSDEDDTNDIEVDFSDDETSFSDEDINDLI